MKKTTIRNQKYAFITVVFLVLALSCLSFFTFFNHRNAAQLTETVNSLTDTRDNMEKIDRAIQLLYVAENNSRMYVVYRDPTYYQLYNKQLAAVSAIIDSIRIDENESDNLNNLIRDKQAKTQLFTRAKVLLDSLLINGGLQTIKYPEIKKLTFEPEKRSALKVDTSVHNDVVTKKNKKGIFKRLKDAIVNKADSLEVNNLTISRSAQDSIILSKQNELKRQTVNLQNQSAALAQLKQKEKAVLIANHLLFENLENLLSDLKTEELNAQQQRKSILSKNASSLASNLETNSILLALFGLLLTVIILLFLRRMFKNGLALKKAKDEAEEYARLKSEFAETMSHEIRTPLHSIQAFSQELSAGHSVASQSEVVDAIRLSSHMLLSVVNNILDYTKMEKGKFKLASVPFNPNGVILETLAGMQLQAKRKNIALVQKLDKSLNRTLLGDAFQLRQLLINLLSNAIKYTDEGAITIEARLTTKSPSSAVLKLSIKDTGIGIEDQKSAHLFDAYVTSVHRREIKEGSTGLGLSIVKNVVDLHKGRITADSTIGKGTTFEIELPYTISDKKIPAISPAGQKVDVLVVDDDALNLKYFDLVFGKKNYNVITVQNGEKALELIKNKHFQLVLTDISMPGMNGIELARQIRALKDKERSLIPIIALTGHEINKGDQQQQKGLINAWLVKPFDPKELDILIDTLIRQQ